MSRIYLGRLSEHDPLHGYLQQHIQSQISGGSGSSSSRAFRLNGSNDVYLYEDRGTGTKIIGKYFLTEAKKKDSAKAVARLTREFENLSLMRDYGLTGYPHHVVKPGDENSRRRHIVGNSNSCPSRQSVTHQRVQMSRKETGRLSA